MTDLTKHDADRDIGCHDKDAATAAVALLLRPEHWVTPGEDPQGCPDDESFVAYAGGKFSSRERATFLGHIDRCPLCRGQLLRLMAALDIPSVKAAASAPRPFAWLPRLFSSPKRTAFALAACMVLAFTSLYFHSSPEDRWGYLYSEFADLRKTRGPSASWLRSLDAAGNSNLTYFLQGYANEARRASKPEDDNAPDVPAASARPYVNSGRLLFYAERFCERNGSVSEKQWENLRALWEDAPPQGAAFAALRELFGKNTVPACASLREAAQSIKMP